MIVNFNTAIVAFLPGIGKIAIPGLRAILLMLGVIGKVALTIYRLIDDPSSWGFKLFELLVNFRPINRSPTF